MAEPEQPSVSALSILVQLEALARSAESPRALTFLAVNESRRLFSYRQGFYFSAAGGAKAEQRLEAASSLSDIDRQAPLVKWLEQMVSRVKSDDPGSARQLDRQLCPEELRTGWDEFSLPFVFWCPLCLPNGHVIGGLWFGRETPWKESEQALVKRLADTYAHAMGALESVRGRSRVLHVGKKPLGVGVVAVLLLMLLPVRMSALAPAEVVAMTPAIVSAPMDGVIATIERLPNSEVQQGDLLFSFENTNLRNRYQISERGLEVALAELRKATQGAFSSQESKSEISLLRTRVERQRAERDYEQELLSQVEVRAPTDGVLLYGEQADWIGRPVQTGERIMHIADPTRVRVRLDLAVADAIVLIDGARVKLFLDKDPLNPLEAVLVRSSYNAEITAEKVLAYRLDADFVHINNPNSVSEQGSLVADHPRIGLQGTGKIYGERVSLFFYLFRRPLSSLRQFIGY